MHTSRMVHFKITWFMIFNVIQFCGTEDDKTDWSREQKWLRSQIEVPSKQSYFKDITLHQRLSTRSESLTQDPYRSLLHRRASLQLQDGSQFRSGKKNGLSKYKQFFSSMLGMYKNSTLQDNIMLPKQFSSDRPKSFYPAIKREQPFLTRNILKYFHLVDNNLHDPNKSYLHVFKNCKKHKTSLHKFHGNIPGNQKLYDEVKLETGRLKMSKRSKSGIANFFSKLKREKENAMDNMQPLIPHAKNNNPSKVKNRIKREIKGNNSESRNFTTEINKEILSETNLSQTHLENGMQKIIVLTKDCSTNKITDLNLKDQNNAAESKSNTSADSPIQGLDNNNPRLNKSFEISPGLIFNHNHITKKTEINIDSNTNNEIPIKLKRTNIKLTSASKMIHPITDKPLLSDVSKDTSLSFQADSGLPSSTSKSSWPVRRVCEVAGDLLLGGLMMVHERSDTVTCGPVMPQGGVQALETMLYTLDVINARGMLPFTLGAMILDDCDKDTYGLEMAVDFIKGSISNIDDAEYHCNKTQVRKVISGVVGAASSVTSIQVANLLRLFKIPQVSFWSTSPELSNKQRFEYFSRTIPSDHYQAQAMVQIVKRLGWSYVSIIYEESNYGIKAFEELEQLLAKAGICIAVKEKLAKDSGVAEEKAYDNVVLKLQTKPRARGAIIFASDQEVAGLMRAVRRCNATGSFSWIGSDGWSARSLVSEGSEPEVEGTLSVQPQANPVQGFDEYFLNLTVENNHRNPWFVEFWEDHFQCRYPNSPATPYNQKFTRNCTSEERLTQENTAFENQLQFVSDAVMSLAVALRDMHADMCRGQGLCADMSPTKGPDLLRYLRRVNFRGLSGDKVHFDASGDGPARYNIIHFKQTLPGVFQWVHVGEYVEGELRLNMSEIQFSVEQPQPPESVCSLPCELGQAKTYVEGESCCWHCFNCTTYEVRHESDETLCVVCPLGTKPDPHHQVCLQIPQDFLRAGSAWAIGAMSFSLIGCLATLFVTGVFARHNDTPVVKAAGRELTYVLLSGLMLCYLVTFALVLRPSDVVCGVQRFGAGFCFTVVYAALFTKTNRISRIFNAGKRTAKRPSFITPRSQLIICSALVAVQVLINGIWMVVSPPRAIHHYPSREDNLLICSSYVDASYMIAFGYPIVLIVVCTVYAVLTRNIPEAFNESKHIGFTMYTTCVIWLAFVPLYFGTGNNMALRITSMSVTISLSASVTVACLFSPKLYIILVHPERNVRQSMMPHPRVNPGPKAGLGSTPGAPDIRPVVTEVTLMSKTMDNNHKQESGEERPQAAVQTSCRCTQTDLEPVEQANGPHF